jgi:hypothetical protein
MDLRGATVIAISIPIPIITVLWIVACVLIGLLAMAKGRSFISWSVAAAWASPVVVLLLIFLPERKQIKQRPAASPRAGPPQLAAPRSKTALPMKAIKALAYRVGTSRAVGALSRRKSAAYQSIENFTAAAEIDKGIAAAVRDEFSNGPAVRIPTKRKNR